MRKTSRKDKIKRRSFKLGTSEGRKKFKAVGRPSLKSVLKIIVAICAFAAAAIGFVVLQQYTVKRSPVSQKKLVPKLVAAPDWINDQIKAKIYTVVTSQVQDANLDEDAARRIQNKLADDIAWLDKPIVQVTGDSILISGKWRKPLGKVKSGSNEPRYIDVNLVVLDFIPLSNLPIIDIKGLSGTTEMPDVGQNWQRDDLAAAMEVLAQLDRMDELVTSDKPLLYEIDSIDIGNFNGRQNTNTPHIVLYAKDKTEIIWGAEIGKWQRYLEAPDKEKLSQLYGYYKKNNSILNSARYIDLRYPKEIIRLPIDK